MGRGEVLVHGIDCSCSIIDIQMYVYIGFLVHAIEDHSVDIVSTVSFSE